MTIVQDERLEEQYTASLRKRRAAGLLAAFLACFTLAACGEAPDVLHPAPSKLGSADPCAYMTAETHTMLKSIERAPLNIEPAERVRMMTETWREAERDYPCRNGLARGMGCATCVESTSACATTLEWGAELIGEDRIDLDAFCAPALCDGNETLCPAEPIR